MSQQEINELKKMLIDQNRKSDEHRIAFENYVKEDKEWKETVTPSIDLMKKIANFSDGTIFVLKLVGLIAGATTGIWALITFLKK